MAFLIVGAALLVAGLAYALRVRRVALEPVAVAGTLVSLALNVYAIVVPLHGQRQGAALARARSRLRRDRRRALRQARGCAT